MGHKQVKREDISLVINQLVFRRYGDQFFLSQIWEAGDRDGHELRTSRGEAELQRLMAKNSTKPEMVVVSGRRPR